MGVLKGIDCCHLKNILPPDVGVSFLCSLLLDGEVTLFYSLPLNGGGLRRG